MSAKPWATSTRKQHVGSGWQQQRDNQRILARHAGICHVCHRGGATEVDHVIPLSRGGSDTDANKRPIHGKPCHEDKTRAESAAARWPNQGRRKRAAEPHPGRVTPGGDPRTPRPQGVGGDYASGWACAETSGLQEGEADG